MHVAVHSESVVPLIQMIVIFWGFTIQWLCYFHRTVLLLSRNTESVPVIYRNFRVVQLVADMEGGKKRVKDFFPNQWRQSFLGCKNHVLLEVTILGIFSKMRMRLKLVSWDYHRA